MKKTAFIIMIITIFSKFLGLGRDLFLSYFFGAAGISDAYLVSLTIPSVIFGFISIGIVTAYIPMQSRIVSQYGEKEGTNFTNNFVNINLVMVTVILVAGLVFTEQIVKVFALGFSGDTLDMTIKFTRVSLFGMYFSALISIFSGYLQVRNNYIVPALIPFPLNIIIIISILFAYNGNYIILVYGTLLATAAQFLMLIPFIRKENFKYKAFIDFKDENIIKTFYIALPAVIGISVN